MLLSKDTLSRLKTHASRANGKLIIKVGQQINFGKKLMSGMKLEETVRTHYLYGISRCLEDDLPIYKHFSKQYESILEVTRQTGSLEESKLKRFHEVLAEDIKVEKTQREFMISNILQMLLIGFITAFVMLLANNYINVGQSALQIYVHCLIELFGFALFIYLVHKSRGRAYKEFVELNQVVQSLSVYCSSGVSVSDAISLSGYNHVADRFYKGQQLEIFRKRLTQSIGIWLESGVDCEEDLKNLLSKLSGYFIDLNKKNKRIVSSLRLFVMAIFFLGSYLVNTLILLQTFISESFYTPT